MNFSTFSFAELIRTNCEMAWVYLELRMRMRIKDRMDSGRVHVANFP